MCRGMMFVAKRKLLFPLAFVLAVGFYYTSNFYSLIAGPRWHYGSAIDPSSLDNPDYSWRKLPTHYPVQTLRPLPTGKPLRLPKVQHQFGKEIGAEKAIRLERQHAVQEIFGRCWNAYREHAWLQDELAPVSGGAKNSFGGWSVLVTHHSGVL